MYIDMRRSSLEGHGPGNNKGAVGAYHRQGAEISQGVVMKSWPHSLRPGEGNPDEPSCLLPLLPVGGSARGEEGRGDEGSPDLRRSERGRVTGGGGLLGRLLPGVPLRRSGPDGPRAFRQGPLAAERLVLPALLCALSVLLVSRADVSCHGRPPPFFSA